MVRQFRTKRFYGQAKFFLTVSGQAFTIRRMDIPRIEAAPRITDRKLGSGSIPCVYYTVTDGERTHEILVTVGKLDTPATMEAEAIEKFSLWAVALEAVR